MSLKSEVAPQLAPETLARLLEKLDLTQFTALDLETTGLDPGGDEIIELGAVRFREGQPKERFAQLVRPGLGLPERIAELTGISATELEHSPSLEAVLPQFLEFIGPGPVVAHNAAFDQAFLRDGAARLGLEMPKRWLDTFLLARALLPRRTGHGLEELARAFALPEAMPHRAVADAERAGLLLLKLIARGLEVPPAVLQELALFSGQELRKLFRGLIAVQKELKLKVPQRRVYPIWKPRPAPPKNEEFLLDLEEIVRVFRRDGPLARALPGYRERPEQQALARAVAEALNAEKILVAEAGTGTGKSFAYLIPAILWARGRGRPGRVIVSTNTKNLQDQLHDKDLPLLRRALGIDFQAVRLKGRNNYICLHRWQEALRERALEPALAFMEEERGGEGGGERDDEGLYLSLPLWLAETETGDIEENGAFWRGERARRVWEGLADNPDYCLGPSCPFYESCFSLNARRAAREADLVVVNHALLLADLEEDHAVLGPYDYLIIDEAHNLPQVATEHFSQELSFWMINGLLERLHHERPRPGGLLLRLRASGLSRLKEVEELIGLSRELRRDASLAFNALTAALRERHQEEQGDYALKERYRAGFFEEIGLDEDLGRLKEGLTLLAHGLERVLIELEAREAKEPEEQGTIAELRAALAQARWLVERAEALLRADDERFVFWYELPREADRLVTLHATPLDVADQLHDKLFSRLKACILTSATLAVAGKFDYFLQRTGLDRLPEERIEARAFGDPFDYKKKALLAVPEFLPELDEAEFPERLAELLWELSRRLRRRMMVLFTSYSLLQRVQRELEARGPGLALWAQGPEASRSQLLHEFRHSADRQAVLLGTSSFWEGVDLPGEELEVLVLTRLPFPVPDEPVVAARAERIREAGGDPFYEYFLPQAVLKLRQGFGRLIRTHEDRGAVIITDTRIVRRNYGRHFRASLPTPLVTYYTPSRLLIELEEFFAKEGN